MWELLDIICALLEIAVEVIAIGETIASFFWPKHLMPDYAAKIIKERLRNPRAYLTTCRVSSFLLGVGFMIRGVGDLIGPYDIRGIPEALWWLLFVASAAVFLCGNRVYLDMWLPPRKPASEKSNT